MSLKAPVLLALFLLAVNHHGVAASADLLEPYTWEKRLLLIFSPRPQDPRMQQQNEMLTGLEADLLDRDLVVLRLSPDSAVDIDGVPASAADLYRDFAIAPTDFAVVLVGKDGTVKLLRRSPISASTIFDLIDAMPMRQWEMQNQGAFTNQE